MSNTLKGILWINAVMLSNAFIFILVKETSSEMSPFQIVFLSNIFALLMLLPWTLKQGIKTELKTNKMRFYVLRSLFEVTAFSCVFYAIPLVPLSTATALQFLSPLLSVTLVVIVLGERARAYTWICMIIGLVGVLLIVRPDAGGFDKNAFYCIAAALCFSAAPPIVSRLVVTEPTTRVAFYFCFLMSALSLPLAMYDWRGFPTGATLGWCVLMGVFSLFSQLAFGQALSKAKVTVVMPFFFTNLIFATLLAAVIYGEEIAPLTIFGGAIILASAIYATRESLKSHKNANTEIVYDNENDVALEPVTDNSVA